MYKYAVGTSGSDSGYTKITCVKSYKVKNNVSDLINFKNAVIEANGYFDESGLTIGEAAAVLAAFAVLYALNAGIGILITVLGGTYGLTFKSINALKKCYETGEKARNYYDSAKLSAV